jgi:hypothetical protein
MRRVAIASAVASNYVSFARVLADSLRRHAPDLDLFVAVTDDACGHFDARNEPFHVLTAADLSIRHPERFFFAHARREAAIAAKPYVLERVLDERYDLVVFIDADVLVLAGVGSLVAEAERHAVTLVPHFLEPPSGPDRHVRELDILRAGTFNGGVLAVRESPAARLLLAWWKERVSRRCVGDPSGGLHYDQRWLDLVPGFVGDVGTIRDPGCNVAHWNLPERPIRLDGGTVTAAGVPCSLFHFSGFEPTRPGLVSRYRPDMLLSHVSSDVAELFARYYAALLDADWRTTSAWPYRHDTFDNGVRIPRAAREAYASLREDEDRFGNPFAAGVRDSFFEWLRTPADGWHAPNRLWRSVYAGRQDLQTAFPDAFHGNGQPFADWVRRHGLVEHDVPDELG